jgi:hypothetical protein
MQLIHGQSAPIVRVPIDTTATLPVIEPRRMPSAY